MVIVTESMTNPGNSIFWFGVKLDFGSECTVNPSLFFLWCFPSTGLRRGFILIQSSKHEEMVMLSSVNVESGGCNTLVNFLGSWQ